MRYRLLLAITAAALTGGTAAAQLLPSLPVGGGVGGVVGQLPVAGPVARPILERIVPAGERQAAIRPSLDRLGVSSAIASLPEASLLDLRRLRLQQLLTEYKAELEPDDRGYPVRRGVLVAIDPNAASLAAATRAGYRLVGQESDPELGLRTVMLAVPARLNARQALKRLRQLAPSIDADYDHIYEPAGGALATSGAALAAQGGARSGTAIAMIDGGVASHSSLAGASIEQRGFAGQAKATGHGTAVASLLVGSDGAFRGAARGARLYVADIYGGRPSAGSASAVVRALAWAASKRPSVISVSLVGPSNRLLQRAVQILAARGIPMAAAVGNDGPAAPVQYPAAYPGVVAVTAVDARDRALPEAGKAARLDYAAPGADMIAALPGKGFSPVRGTSFATPLVAARLAFTGNPQALAREAVPGRGKVGRGIVCKPCRTDPKVLRGK